MGMIHKFQSNILFRVWVEFMLSLVPEWQITSNSVHIQLIFFSFSFFFHLFEVASSF
jgi:hypothetical protein